MQYQFLLTDLNDLIVVMGGQLDIQIFSAEPWLPEFTLSQRYCCVFPCDPLLLETALPWRRVVIVYYEKTLHLFFQKASVDVCV